MGSQVITYFVVVFQKVVEEVITINFVNIIDLPWELERHNFVHLFVILLNYFRNVQQQFSPPITKESGLEQFQASKKV